MPITVKLKSGIHEIEVQGEQGEVMAVLAKHWVPLIQSSSRGDREDETGESNKAASSPAKGKSQKRLNAAPDTGESDSSVKVIDIVNGIKSHEKFETVLRPIFEDKNRWGKCRLVLHLAGVPLTSGDIYKVLKEIGIRIDTPSISHCLKDNGNKMIQDGMRVKGAPTKYKLSSTAEGEVKKALQA